MSTRWTGKIHSDSHRYHVPDLRIDRRRREALFEHFVAYHAMAGERLCELPIFFPAGSVLRDRQVMNFQTPTFHEPGVFSGHQYQPVAPSIRQYRGSLLDAVGVVTEGPLKRR